MAQNEGTSGSTSRALAAGPSTGGSAGKPSKYIGVDDDYVRPTLVDDIDDPLRRVAPGVIRGGRMVGMQPLYNDAWYQAQLANMSPEDLWSYQQKLARAGFIGPKTRVKRGWWDDTTRNAFKNALELANIYATDLDSILNMAMDEEGGLGSLVSPLGGLGGLGGGGEGDIKPFTGKKTRKDSSVDLTNPQQARVALRRVLREELGRAPSAAEISAFVAALNATEQKTPRVSTTTSEYVEDELVSTNTSTSGGVDSEAFLDEQVRTGALGAERASFMRDTDYYDAAMSVLGEGGGRL